MAWTLVGVVGIDPGVATGWPGPHLKDEGCLPSPLSTARPSPCLSLSAFPSRTLSPTTMRESTGEKRKRRAKSRGTTLSAMLVSRERKREKGKEGVNHLAHQCIIFLLFVMSSPIKFSKKHRVSIGEICECRLLLGKEKFYCEFSFFFILKMKRTKENCSFH